MGVKEITWNEAGERLVAGLREVMGKKHSMGDEDVLDKAAPSKLGTRLSADTDRSMVEKPGNKGPSRDKLPGKVDPTDSDLKHKVFEDDIKQDPTQKQDLEKVQEFPPDVITK